MLKTKILSRSVLIILVITVLAYATWYVTRPDPIEVELATITRGIVEATVVNTRAGTIKACRRANLSPASGGQITQLWVKEGDRVQKGQTLLALWNADLVAQHELAQRQLSMAQERSREACIIADNAHRESTRTQQLVTKVLSARKVLKMRTPRRVHAKQVVMQPGQTSSVHKHKSA